MNKTYAMHMTTFPQVTDIQECVFSFFSFKDRLLFRSVCKKWNDVIEGKNKTENNRTDIGICLQVFRNPEYKIYLDFLGLKDPNKAKNEARVLLSAMYDKKYDLVEALIQNRANSPIVCKTPLKEKYARIYFPCDFAYRLCDKQLIALFKKHGYRSQFFDEQGEPPAKKNVFDDDYDYAEQGPRIAPANQLLLNLLILPFLIDNSSVNNVLNMLNIRNGNNPLQESKDAINTTYDNLHNIISDSLLFMAQYQYDKNISFLYYFLSTYDESMWLYLPKIFIEKAYFFKNINLIKQLIPFYKDINCPNAHVITNENGHKYSISLRERLLESDFTLNDKDYNEQISELLKITEEEQKAQELAVELFNEEVSGRILLAIQERQKIEQELNAQIDKKNNATKEPEVALAESVQENELLVPEYRFHPDSGKPWNVFMTTRQKLSYFAVASALLASFAFLVKHLYQRTA